MLDHRQRSIASLGCCYRGIGLRHIAALFIAFFSCNIALGQDHAGAEKPCSYIEDLLGNPLRKLPKQTQSAMKEAIRPAFEVIAHDPGMGLENAEIDTAELNALPITKPTASGTLYVVAWDDHSFGVNGFNWIVEVTSHGARNLMPPPAPDLRVLSGGFGVGVLAQRTARYPEVVFASKGFAAGGGAEAESVCFHKAGSFYQPFSCPATCQPNLNAR